MSATASSSAALGTVVDIGSSLTKAGFAGEEAPRHVFRSVVGVARHRGLRASLLDYPSDVVGGDEAVEMSGLLDLTAPVQGGHVIDFNAFEKLLFYCLYHKLGVAAESTPFLLLEPSDQRTQDREQSAELLFEHFNVPLLGLLNTSTATVYGTGHTTGIAIDSGAGKTMVAAVVDGYCMQHTMRPSQLAGDALTDALYDGLVEKGYPLSTTSDRRLVESVKIKCCRVSASTEEDRRLLISNELKQIPYELPDHERVYLFEHEFMVPERLFDPSLLGSAEAAELKAPLTPTGYSSSNPRCQQNLAGWPQLVEDVIAASPASVRSDLYRAVVLGGGTSTITNLENRLQRELVDRHTARAQADPEHPLAEAAAGGIKCLAFPERAVAAWTGGSVWANTQQFGSSCLSKADYHEHGANIVHRYAF